MPNPPSTAIQRPPAFVRRRLPWLLLALGMLLVCTMLGHARPAPAAVSLTAINPVLVSPDRGHPEELPDLIAIAESSAESSRSARQRPADTQAPPATAAVTALAGVFVAAATDTLLQHAVERSRRYPLAPYLLLNPGHAPPRV